MLKTRNSFKSVLGNTLVFTSSHEEVKYVLVPRKAKQIM
jgi:hypothetical protein